MMNRFSIAASGHRPEKLWGYNLDKEQYKSLQKFFENFIIDKINQGYDEVEMISGMALGVDTIFAKAAIVLKLKDYPVRLVSAIPFEGQETKWPVKNQQTYRKILKYADEKIVVSEGGYAPWKLNERNKYMVNRADLILAIWNGTKSGTKNCIDYANRKKKEVIIKKVKEFDLC